MCRPGACGHPQAVAAAVIDGCKEAEGWLDPLARVLPAPCCLQKNHLSGLKRSLLKISCFNTQQLMQVRAAAIGCAALWATSCAQEQHLPGAGQPTAASSACSLNALSSRWLLHACVHVFVQVRRLLEPQVEAAKTRAATTQAYGAGTSAARQQQVRGPKRPVGHDHTWACPLVATPQPPHPIATTGSFCVRMLCCSLLLLSAAACV